MRLGHPDNDGDQDGDDDDDDEHDDDIIMKMNMVMVMVKLMIQSTKMMVDLEKQVLSNDNFMTILVHFQLIFLSYKIYCMSRTFALHALSRTDIK